MLPLEACVPICSSLSIQGLYFLVSYLASSFAYVCMVGVTVPSIVSLYYLLPFWNLCRMCSCFLPTLFGCC